MGVTVNITKRIKQRIDQYGNIISTEETNENRLGGGGADQVPKGTETVAETPQG